METNEGSLLKIVHQEINRQEAKKDKAKSPVNRVSSLKIEKGFNAMKAKADKLGINRE